MGVKANVFRGLNEKIHMSLGCEHEGGQCFLYNMS